MPIITNKVESTIDQTYLKTLIFQKREISLGLTFSQESVNSGTGRLTNLYWAEIDKTRFNFRISSTTTPAPLIGFNLSDMEIVAGINFGCFFLSDDFVFLNVPFYNLLINDGQVWQFPSNRRPALITTNGQIKLEDIPARGNLKIGERIFSWSGTNEKFISDSGYQACTS